MKPLIINVMGASVDGAIAAHREESDDARAAAGISEPGDRAHLERLLEGADAVIVGAHSVNVSGGVIPTSIRPTWLLLSNHGFASDAPIWHHPSVTKWLVSKAPLPAERTAGAAAVFTYEEEDMVTYLVRLCAEKQFERVLLFGGGIINRAFYAAGAVDELILTIFPSIMAQPGQVPIVAPGIPAPLSLNLERTETSGNLIMAHYTVRYP